MEATLGSGRRSAGVAASAPLTPAPIARHQARSRELHVNRKPHRPRGPPPLPSTLLFLGPSGAGVSLWPHGLSVNVQVGPVLPLPATGAPPWPMPTPRRQLGRCAPRSAVQGWADLGRQVPSRHFLSGRWTPSRWDASAEPVGEGWRLSGLRAARDGLSSGSPLYRFGFGLPF